MPATSPPLGCGGGGKNHTITGMRVTVSVGGRFHAFNLATELERHGALARLITSYPKFEVVKHGIPREKVCSKITKEIVERAWTRMPGVLKRTFDPSFLIHELFDRAASGAIVPSDIFVGWSSFSLHSLRNAHSLGAKTIVERGSSHIEYQRDVLREEYERWGVAPPLGALPHPRIVEKELREYEEADAISISSQFVKRTFLSANVPERKLIHVPYGVDLTQFRQAPKTDGVFRVVFAGGISLRKGVPYLLKAFSELNLPNSELLFIGTLNEEMRPFFKEYRDRFKWQGHIPQARLHRYYSQGSVFVLPSIEEGLALVIPQAMACGLPIIATTNTGAEDIVRDGTDGFIIPIREVEALKKKILHLYEHPEEQERMGRSAKERVSSGFTWSDYGAKIIRSYEHILQGAGEKN